MRLLFVTGGTGGHIYPALALAACAKQRYQNLELLFIGNDDRMEAQLIPEAGYAFRSLHTSGLCGNAFHKAKAIAQMFHARAQAIKILKEWKPDLVVGFGGYVSAPVILAAHKLHIPIMIHEQNSVAGAANQMVARYADGIVICYERLFEQFDKRKTRLLGNPRATSAAQVKFDAAYYRSLQLDGRKKLILVVMGSLGSSSINAIMCEALPNVHKDYQILFVTGKEHYEDVKKQIPKQDNIHVVDYVKTLEIMEKVDLIICRAGATTLAEITTLGVPSIVIHSHYVAHNHQYYNASVLANVNAAVMIEEKDLKADLLNEKISCIMGNAKLRAQMKEHAKSLGFPNASEDICDWFDEMKR